MFHFVNDIIPELPAEINYIAIKDSLRYHGIFCRNAGNAQRLNGAGQAVIVSSVDTEALTHVSRQLLLSCADELVDAGLFQLGQEGRQNIIGVNGAGHQVEGVLGVDVGQSSIFGIQSGGIEDKAAQRQRLGRVVTSGDAIPKVDAMCVGG